MQFRTTRSPVVNFSVVQPRLGWRNPVLEIRAYKLQVKGRGWDYLSQEQIRRLSSSVLRMDMHTKALCPPL